MAPPFSLQSVLDVRHGRVEAREVELGKLLALLNEAQSLLKAQQEIQRQLFENLSAAQSGEMDLFKIAALRSDVQQTDARLKRIAEEIGKLEKAVDAKRRELVEAKQEEETLQILKRKRIEEFNAEMALKEARSQDDIYIASAFRQRKEQE